MIRLLEEKDREMALGLLDWDHELNLIMIYDIAHFGLEDRGLPFQVRYYGAFREGELCGMAVLLNFGFLKDPLIVNDIFLKRPDRIEVLGFILLTSLLVWNLMEHVMREHLRRTDSIIPGWDRKPTSFMMTTKFKGVLVAKVAEEWHFTAPLSSEQQHYIRALGLSEELLLRKGNTGNMRNQKLPQERL